MKNRLWRANSIILQKYTLSKPTCIVPPPPTPPTQPIEQKVDMLGTLERDLGLAEGTVLRVFKTTRGEYEIIYKV